MDKVKTSQVEAVSDIEMKGINVGPSRSPGSDEKGQNIGKKKSLMALGGAANVYNNI